MPWRGAIQRLTNHKAARQFGALLRNSALFLVAAMVVVLLFVSGVVRPLDQTLSAWRARLLHNEVSGGVVVVAIDAESLRAQPQWPWPRRNYARAIQNLRAAGAGLIGFDVDFSARSSEQDDQALAESIAIDPGSVALPTFVQEDGGSVNVPLQSIAPDALVASVNIPIDSDGSVRRYRMGFGEGDRYHPALAALLAGAPYGDRSSFLIDYSIDWRRIDRISFDSVLRGDFDPARVRGKAVIIGATALELGDEFATPVHPAMPGVYLHALAFENIRQGRAMFAVNALVVLALAFGVMLALWPRRGVAVRAGPTLVKHTISLALLLAAPVVVAAAAPVSLDLGLVLIAQLICAAASVQRELSHRAAEIVRQRETYLEHAAMHDPETELPNRRAIQKEIVRRLGDGRAQKLAVVAIGIDRFAMLRGAIGYANAGQIVRQLAQRVAECSGEAQVFHLATSALAVVLEVEDGIDAVEGCRQRLQHLDTSVFVGSQHVETSVRAGVAVTEPGLSADALLEGATIALDQARLRNERLCVFDQEQRNAPIRQLALVSDVARGLARNEFSLHYQPKARAADGAIVGAEALMRWRHPEHGDISPDHFITAAEETGTIDLLTRWALARAIEDQTIMAARAPAPPISVNLSGRLLGDAEFCAFAIDLVKHAQGRICLEITETAIIDDPTEALASLAAFRSAGMRISVDDYGSGLSSLAYLKQIAADELKLDKSLISDLRTSARDRLILKSTIDLAHGLGMSVVAEGVEDNATRQALAALGCDLIQGYLVARPLALDSFLDLLAPDAPRLAAGSRPSP